MHLQPAVNRSSYTVIAVAAAAEGKDMWGPKPQECKFQISLPTTAGRGRTEPSPCNRGCQSTCLVHNDFFFHHPANIKYSEGYKSNQRDFHQCHSGLTRRC